MATIEKMQPRPFKRKFLTPFAAPNTLWKQNTAVAASRRYSLNEFKKAWEIYPNDAGADRKTDAPAHHSNEFPAGYSLAGCSPAGPASASPATPSWCKRDPTQGTSFSGRIALRIETV
jgi:hypothetical protein